MTPSSGMPLGIPSSLTLQFDVLFAHWEILFIFYLFIYSQASFSAFIGK